jgi:hypothetical protein
MHARLAPLRFRQAMNFTKPDYRIQVFLLQHAKWQNVLFRLGPTCEEKPRSQKRDLGHPLKVWSLQPYCLRESFSQRRNRLTPPPIQRFDCAHR